VEVSGNAAQRQGGLAEGARHLEGSKKLVVALSDIRGVGYNSASSVVKKLNLEGGGPRPKAFSFFLISLKV
jgi:hypothetical protein